MGRMPLQPFTSVDELIQALHAIADDPGEDAVPVLCHLLQCAQLLAEQLVADLEAQVAGLVHDLASAARFGAPGDGHARASAEVVPPLLGDRVARLVAGHADAERYALLEALARG